MSTLPHAVLFYYSRRISGYDDGSFFNIVLRLQNSLPPRYYRLCVRLYYGRKHNLSAHDHYNCPTYDPEKPDVIFFDNEVTTRTLPNQENLDFIAQILYGTAG
jgi:hypothetical protein